MNPREFSEYKEKEFLSPFACLSCDTKGRPEPAEKCQLRTEFQRDRDKILHSKSFRRLKHKTQVFLSPRGDHYRTRLTHTLEVSQIARTVARALRLNEDLAEAISLGHDLGHTPFGHAGERALSKVSEKGFHHNEQSLRVVDVLENLNLTYEVRDGILNHTGKGTPSTLEGKVVCLADKIAYINHDIDDAVRGGVLEESTIPREYIEILGETHAERINSMIFAIIRSSENKNDILMDEPYYSAMMNLRKWMFDNVYFLPFAQIQEEKSFHIIKNLYNLFMEKPHLIGAKEDVETSVLDFISGMSDRYAISEFKKYFLPSSWHEGKDL